MARRNTLALSVVFAVIAAAGCQSPPPEPAPEAAKADNSEVQVREQGVNCAAPTINASNVVKECSGAETQVFINPEVTSTCDPLPQVSFSLNGRDINDPHGYALGSSLVTINAEDNQGLRSNRRVGVRVQDTRPPVVSIASADITVDCTSPDGAVVDENRLPIPNVNDACDETPSVSNNVPADRQFPFGTTRVDVTATDFTGNVTRSGYNVSVVDQNDPVVEAGPDLFIPRANDCDRPEDEWVFCCNSEGGTANGTRVTLPLPSASDTCHDSSALVLSSRIGANANPTRNVCVPNNAALTVTWDAFDPSGNSASDFYTVTVSDGNEDLSVSVTDAPSGWTNAENAEVTMQADGGAAPYTWGLFGDAVPTTAPGTGRSTTAGFSTEGTYCPLYIVAQANGGERGLDGSACFGIERSAPTGEYNAIPDRWFSPNDPNVLVEQDAGDPTTWPVFFAGETIGTNFTATDRVGTVRSGMRRARLVIDREQAGERVLSDHSYTGAGRLPIGALNIAENGCNTEDAACNENGRINAALLGDGNHTISLVLEDQAGNEAVYNYNFRVKNYAGALDDIDAWIQALIDEGGNAGALSHLEKAQGFFQSAQRLFTSSPGYAFLISRLAWLELDEAEAQGLDTELIRQFVTRAINAEVRRLTDITAAQRGRNGSEFNENWYPILDAGNAYTQEALLIGKEQWFVDVNSTLELTRQYLSASTNDLGDDLYLSSIDNSLRAFDSLQILYRDEVYAEAFGRDTLTYTDDRGIELEFAYFRGNGDSNGNRSAFGYNIAGTIAAQIELLNQDPGVPQGARATLERVAGRLAVLQGAVRLIENSQNGIQEEIMRDVYLNAQFAIEELRQLNGASVYTYNLQTGMAYVLSYIVNYSLYEGPTAINKRRSGDTNWRGETIQSQDDDTFKSIQCRYDRGVQAIFDGRLEGEDNQQRLNSALDLFQESKCAILNLYNKYYGYSRNFNTRNLGSSESLDFGLLDTGNDRPIDPELIGCPGGENEIINLDVAAECPCAGNPDILNAPDSDCDGIDDNCNGLVDEGYTPVTCGGDGVCGGTSQCLNGIETECQEGQPLSDTDSTCDGVDDDCDGVIDDDYIAETCGSCGCEGQSSCVDGIEQPCRPRPPQREVCDGIDNDCNCRVDEGFDNDGDGFPSVAGECDEIRIDCDDNNPFINPDALEICDVDALGNPIDNDCDGLFNEDVTNRCGDCDPGCTFDSFGVCDDCNAFNPVPNDGNGNGGNSNGVGLDEDGRLTLDSQSVDTQFAYVANSGLGWVSKFDTRTGNEVAVYSTRVDRVNGGSPSRTAIDSKGNCWVGNRSHSSVNGGATKIGNYIEEACTGDDLSACECVDKNGNGTIETSRDLNGNGRIESNERLNNGSQTDECVLTTVVRGSYVRALAIDAKDKVWVGYWHGAGFHKIDNETYADEGFVYTGVNAYGAVIDARGILWHPRSCCSTGAIRSFDTCSRDDAPANCQHTVGPIRTMPSAGGRGNYGIAVDSQNRVWVASYGQASWAVARYTPGPWPYNTTNTGDWFKVNATCRASSGLGRGVTVVPGTQGQADTVWVAQHGGPRDNACDGGWSGGRISAFNADTGAVIKDVYVHPRCTTPVGVGIGAGGNVWAACQSTNNVLVMSPNPNSSAFNVYQAQGWLYTYSDFTGNIRNSFTAPIGDYSVAKKACAGTQTLRAWDRIFWNVASRPAGSEVNFYIRVAANEASLDGQDYRLVGSYNDQGNQSPVNLAALDDPALPVDSWFEVKVELKANDQGESPIVSNFEVLRYCE